MFNFFLINSKNQQIRVPIERRNKSAEQYLRVVKEDGEECYYEDEECVNRHAASCTVLECDEKISRLKVRVNFAFHFCVVNLRSIKTRKKTGRTIPIISIYEVAYRHQHVRLEFSDEYRDMIFGVLSFDDRERFCAGNAIQDAPFVLAPIYTDRSASCASKNEMHNVLVVYDCETIQINGRQQPYLIHAVVHMQFEFQHPLSNHTFKYSALMDCDSDGNCTNPTDEALLNDSDCAELFSEWLIDLVKEVDLEMDIANPCIRLIGFNNMKFDNHMILDALRGMPNVYVQSNLRNGKTTSLEISVGRMRTKIYVSDLMNWIPDKSLSEACDDFEIVNKKLNVDIVAFNNYILQKQVVPFKILFTDIGQFLKDNSFAKKMELKKTTFFVQAKYFNLVDYIIEYCKYDCLACVELYNKIQCTFCTIRDVISKTHSVETNFNLFTNYISPSQFAGELFRQFAYIEEQKKISICCNEFGEFITRSYFGGRCDFGLVGTYNFQTHAKYFDVTSEYPMVMNGLYPYILSEEDIIVGDMIDIRRYQLVIDEITHARARALEERTLQDFTIYKKLDTQFQGIFMCNIYPPEDSTNLITFSPIPTRPALKQDSLLYINVEQKNRVLNTAHFKALILTGYRIELLEHEYNIVFTRVGYTFKALMQCLGKLKTEYRESNKTAAKLLKMLMNSIAGKLAQKPIDVLVHYSGHRSQDGDLMSTNNKSVVENWKNSFHYLATFVTQQANFVLYSTMYKLQLHYIYNKVDQSERTGALIYVDTDSILFDPNLCDMTYYKFVCSEELGDWNEEENEFNATWKEKYSNQIDRVVVFGKKAYLYYSKNSLVLTKLKGIHNAQMRLFTSPEIINEIFKCSSKQMKFEGLVRKQTTLPGYYINSRQKHSNNCVDIIKHISASHIKKTLAVSSKFFEQKTTNKNVLTKNAHCGAKTSDGVFLKFSVSKYKTNGSEEATINTNEACVENCNENITICCDGENDAQS
jgi:DNA polymerase type B, organellar and viral